VPGRDLLTVLRRAWWWLLDYGYVVTWQVAGALHRGGAERFTQPADPRPPTVVLIPGVYESWQFMRPLAALIHRHGHPVHVVQKLGYNVGTIPAMAALVADHLVEQGLTDVVVVAHSKGGLIGKYAMLHHDPDGRILGLVAINTPFGGSPYARWIPLAAVRAFVPTDATLAALTAELVVNARITSVSGPFDPHIPGGSDLDGATNVHVRTPGHFRVLHDRELGGVILRALEAARTPEGPDPRGPGTADPLSR
jgi:pimeloyl-ACP methyl ester carboxylesterase